MTATLRAFLVNSSRALGVEPQHLKDPAADGDVQTALLKDAILLRDSGQPDQSLALLDEAVGAGISGDWIDDNRARALVHLNRRSEALAIWDQLAVSSDQGVRQMASEMAQLLRQQQSVEDLWSNLHQVLQVAGRDARFLPATPPTALPDLELPLLQEAIALREAGDSALSLQLLAGAREAGLRSPWIDDNRARALVNQERYGEAVALWRPLLRSDIPALRDGAAAMLLLNEGRALQQAGSAAVLAGERLANGLGRRAYGRWISHHEPRLPDPLLPLQLPFWSIDELGGLCALQGGAGHAIWPAPLGQSTWPLDGWLLLHPQAQLRPGALQALEQWLMQGPADPHQRYPGGWVLPDLVYADEDRLDQQGCRCDPWFKPGWVPESFWSIPGLRR